MADAKSCPHGDPYCPGQDGDPCHYEGPNPMRREQQAVDPTWTYAPDAIECRYGHRFTSEADCFLPEGWDHFMCRKCIAEAGLTEAEVARSLEAW